MLQKNHLKRIDKTGRLTIPKEIRNTVGIKEKDALRISIANNNCISIIPSCASCFFCNSENNLQKFRNWFICDSCIGKIKTNTKLPSAPSPGISGFPIELYENGRIAIPYEIRKTLKINPGDLFRISVGNNKIYLKHIPGSCSFCGGKIDSEDSHLCKNCLNHIKADTYLA